MIQPAGKLIRLEVKDNGKGFSVAEAEGKPRGTGLLWMRRLAQEEGLELQISSQNVGGTAVHALYRPPETS